MNAICKCQEPVRQRVGRLAAGLLVAAWLAADLHAQEVAPPEVVPQGFLELVLAVPGKARCQVKIDGKGLPPGGLKSGQCTGGLVVKAGEVKLQVELDGHGKFTSEVAIKADQTNSYAIFLQAKQDPRTGAIKRVPRLKLIEPPAGRGHPLRVTSLCAGPQQITVAKRPVSLDPQQSLDLPGWNGKRTLVQQDGKTLDQFEAGESGAYVLLVFDDDQGQVGCAMFRHLRYYLPPWLRQNP